jgi:hypothetical protein
MFMKRSLTLVLGLVMALTLVIGSVSNVSAGKPPAGPATGSISITGVNLSAQSTGCRLTWSGFPDSTPGANSDFTPTTYQVCIYKRITDNLAYYVGNTAVSLHHAKTKRSDKLSVYDSFGDVYGGDFVLQSGDTIYAELTLIDEASNATVFISSDFTIP